MIRYHFDCEKCGAHVVSDTSPTLVCSVPVDALGRAVVTMCPDDFDQCGEVLDDPMVYWSDVRARDGAIIRATCDQLGVVVAYPMDNRGWFDAIIASAEQETP